MELYAEFLNLEMKAIKQKPVTTSQTTLMQFAGNKRLHSSISTLAVDEAITIENSEKEGSTSVKTMDVFVKSDNVFLIQNHFFRLNFPFDCLNLSPPPDYQYYLSTKFVPASKLNLLSSKLVNCKHTSAYYPKLRPNGFASIEWISILIEWTFLTLDGYPSSKKIIDSSYSNPVKYNSEIINQNKYMNNK